MRLVVFSGGECFLLGEDLDAAIGHAHRLGLATRCVTNGYWASSLEAALRRLKKLRDVGLTEINFSTGDNHAEYVAVENVLHGARAAKDLGIDVAIMVELSGKRTLTKKTLLAHPLYEEYFAGLPDDAVVSQESPWIAMDPEAPPVDYSEEQLVNSSNVKFRRGCDSVLSTIVATPQRDLKACCGITSEQIPEMRLGSLDEKTMPEMYACAGNDFLKLWIASDGPERILDWAAGKDPSIDWENRFSHQCDACKFLYQDERVRTAIRNHYQEVVPDVLLKTALRAGAQQAELSS